MKMYKHLINKHIKLNLKNGQQTDGIVVGYNNKQIELKGIGGLNRSIGLSEIQNYKLTFYQEG